MVDPPAKPANLGALEALQALPDVEVTDLPSESTEREIGPNGEPLLALARAVDALVAAGLVAQARPLLRQLIAALEGAALAPARSPHTLSA